VSADDAVADEVVRLWPDGAPTPIEEPLDEAAYDAGPGLAVGSKVLRNISDPTLSVFAPPEGTGNGVGVVVAPGGGWMVLMWEHEGVDVARWLTANGYTAFVLKYRVEPSRVDQATFESIMAMADDLIAAPRSTSERPRAMSDVVSHEGYVRARAGALEDGRRAIEIARELAPRYSVRPDAIGMMGFSAGAFLTVDVALDPLSDPLAFIAPIYGGETLGARVPIDAPPMFAAVAHDDILRRIVEGVYLDWSAADRTAELHLFARGQHGFGVVRQGAPSDHWTDLFLAWLEDLGIIASEPAANGAVP
jgi:acetyl esterase/lipase